MWNLITSAAKNIFNAITGSNKPKAPAPKPAPKPAPQPVKQNPINQVISGISSFVNNPAKAVSQQSWLPKQVTNVAAQIAAQQEAARRAEAARREQLRRETQARVDRAKAEAQARARDAAKKAADWFGSKLKKGDWRNFYDDSGNYKGGDFMKDPAGWLIGQGQGIFDPRVKQAKDAWSNWYTKTAEGQARKKADDDAKAVKTEYDRVKKEYYDRSKKIVDGVKNRKSGWANEWFGGKTDEQAAREFSAKALQDLNNNVDRYNKRLKDFTSKQASQYANLQKKLANGTLTQQEADAYNSWVDTQVKDLEYTRAAQEGMYNAYKDGSSAKLTGATSKLFEWTNNSIVQPTKTALGKAWQYTLGQGDENIPSIVTAPMRVINTIGNAADPKRQINQYGNKSQNGLQGKNAWQASFEQRNWNIGNKKDYSVQVDIDNSYKDAVKLYKQQKAPTKFSKWYKDKIPTKQQWLDEEMYDYSTGRQVWAGGTTRYQANWTGQALQNKRDIAGATSDTLEFLSDPMLYVGGLGILNKFGRGATAAGSFLNKFEKVNKATSFMTKNLEKVKANPFVQKLGAEAKTRQQVYMDTVKDANKVIDNAQTKVLPRIRARAEQLAQERKILEGKFDDSVLDDFRRMAEAGDDEAAKWLQTMKNGDFSGAAKIKNWTRVGGLGSNPRLTNLKELADRYGKFSELQRKGDMIDEAMTRFGRGKKQSFYSPRTKYFENLDDYNFRAFKKNTAPQSAEDLYRGMVDRYLKSDVIDYWGNTQKAKVGKMDGQLKTMLDEYDATTGGARAAVEKAYRRTRTPLGRAQGFVNKYGPMALWKKSVLKYHPPWSVNNALYNVQGAALAGGGKALVEQFKNLNPRYLKRAMADLPEGVRAEVANELGKGRLTKFYNNLENSSRVAAFKGAKANGLTDEQALKRVNNYLFDYKTKNWERPFKAAMPFWGWTKNVVKASARMPFDRPAAATAYNKFDRYQQGQFDQDFESVREELQKLGYSDEEINQIREQNRKYYAGKLKVGDKYMNTPFSVFSERGAGEGLASFNPYLMAGIEATEGKDSFGRTLQGSEANILARLRSKFPQLELGKKTLDAFMQNSGKNIPIQKWIGQPGSGGYGLTKEKQGYDPSKPNYDRNMDANKGLVDDWLAFAGKPRTTQFDKGQLVERKRMEKVKTEYFATNDIKDYNQRAAAQDAIFKKYGIKPEEFFDGELAKYDSATTKGIKQQKAEARDLNKKLFEEYSKQPVGTRGTWAVNKLRELTESGYFDNNPFLKSFDWLTSDKVQKVDKKAAYDRAKATGDWSGYRKKYGDTRRVSQKKLDYDRAKSSGDRSLYRKRYGDTRAGKSANAKFWQSYSAEQDPARRRQMLRDNPQYAKRQPKSEAEIAEARFWAAYGDATKEDRKKMLADNPQYNRRAGWSSDDWLAWRASEREKQRDKLKSFGLGSTIEKYKKSNQELAAPVLFKSGNSGAKRKVVWKVR